MSEILISKAKEHLTFQYIFPSPEVRRMHREDDSEQWIEVPVKEGRQCQHWMGRQHRAGIQQQIFFGAQSVTAAGSLNLRIYISEVRRVFFDVLEDRNPIISKSIYVKKIIYLDLGSPERSSGASWIKSCQWWKIFFGAQSVTAAGSLNLRI